MANLPTLTKLALQDLFYGPYNDLPHRKENVSPLVEISLQCNILEKKRSICTKANVPFINLLSN